MNIKEIPAAAKRALGAGRRRFVVLDVVVQTFEEYGEDDGGSYAAALTYYTFFSVFPLVLFATAVLGYLTFASAQLRGDLVRAGVETFPMLEDIFDAEAISTYITQRRQIAITGLAMAIYAGSGGVVALEHALNVMWDVPKKDEPRWLIKRARSLLWLTVFSATAILSLAFGTAASFSERLLRDTAFVSETVGFVVGHAGGMVVGLLIFGSAYKFLPAVQLSWRQVLPGALLAAFLFEILKEGAAWYLTQGADTRRATFATFTTAAGLLIVSYFIAHITLICAELNAVLTRRRKRGRTAEPG